MPAFLGAALVIGVIGAACVAPFYCYKQASQGRDEKYDESSEVESPLVHIRISRPYRDNVSNDTSSSIRKMRGDSAQNTVDTNNNEDVKNTAKSAVSQSGEESEVVPVRPPRRRRMLRRSDSALCNHDCAGNFVTNNNRSSSSIWSSAMQNQLENLANSSSALHYGGKLVSAQVKVYPRSSMSANKESPDSLRRGSISQQNSSSSKLAYNYKHQDDDRTNRLTTIVIKKWRSLKRTLIGSRSQKVISSKHMENEQNQRLSIPVPVSSRQSPVGHSTMLRKNRLVDASTSTRISANIMDSREIRNEAVARIQDSGGLLAVDNNVPTDRETSNADILENIVSLISRQSTNGKSFCDVKISGLAMNQSDLLDLFEATNGRSQTASVVTTEEASIISIKFHRDSHNNSNAGRAHKEHSHLEYLLRTFYRHLPGRLEDVSFSKLFRAYERFGESSSRAFDSSVLSPRMKASNATNGTSYFKFPKVNEASLSTGDSGISRRISEPRFPRFFERQRD